MEIGSRAIMITTQLDWNDLLSRPMFDDELNPELRGWWRITSTSQWVDDGLDILGPAMLSITGYADRCECTACSPT